MRSRGDVDPPVRRVRAELVVDARNDVGEGPCWDEHNQELVWVDVFVRQVHRLRPRDGRHSRLELPQAVGAAVPCQRGGWLLGVEQGFARLDLDTGAFTMLADAGSSPATYMNDGKCDPLGRFWAGTAPHDDATGTGVLFRLDPDLSVHRVLEGVTISNGLAWSGDGCTMYYIDSVTRAVEAFDFDLPGGTLSNRRTIAVIDRGDALPDGMTIDTEGYLWVALWDGGAVHRFAPDGRLDLVVDVPASLVTSCTFGGPGMDELYITTARMGLDEAALLEQPAAGGVFRCRPGVTGLPVQRYAG